MADKKQEQTTTTGTSEAIYNKLIDMGLTVCKQCKSKLRTDLNGNLFCPINDNNCPVLKLKNNELV